MDRIIRICSLAALLLPIAAEARRPEPSALGLYMRGRVAASADQSLAATQNYAAALTADPDNPRIAFRAYREAIEAGQFPLAVRAAQVLDKAGDVPPDAHILLYLDAVQARDWTGAKARLQELADEQGLGFIAPMLGRWIERLVPAPVVLRSAKAIDRGANAYADENDALISLSKGQVDDAVVSIKGMWTLDPYRAGSLRLAAASRLVELGKAPRALDLIVADDGAANKARALIERRRKLGVSVASPSQGAAFLLARMAGDLIVEGSSRSALTMARMAQYADPKNARIRLIVAGALAARKDNAAALAIAEGLLTDPLYGDDAASFRIDQLQAVGQIDAALAEAKARAANSPNDQARIGDIESRRRNHAAAAAAYDEAVTLMGDRATAPLVFAAANAHDNAGNWKAALPLLERALAMTPDDPAMMNELGHGLIEHGGDMTRGLRLVGKAAAMRPDDAGIVDSLGWAEYQRGAFLDAIPLLERAIRLDNTQAEIGEHLGDAYWAAGRHIDARYAWAAARVQADGDAVARLDGKISGKS